MVNIPYIKNHYVNISMVDIPHITNTNHYVNISMVNIPHITNTNHYVNISMVYIPYNISYM